MTEEIKLFNEQSNELITLNKEQLAKIQARFPEFYRASSIIGHSTSQTSYSLQTMNMISDSAFARLKQCLAQINKKQSAFRENYFKAENKKLEIRKLSIETDEVSVLKVRQLESELHDISLGLENTLRQIGMFQDMYESIRKNGGIKENWSEKDFEEQEIEHMIRSSFRIAIQDLTSTVRISRAAVEYWEQLGIHPQLAEMRVRDYMVNTQKILVDTKEITIQLMYDFLDEMVKEFKDTYKLALKRNGLDEIGSEYFMAKGATKPQ